MQFEIHSPYSEADVIRILKENTDTSHSFFAFGMNRTYFTGTIEAPSFKIYRRIHYNNPFLPEITGTIEAAKIGTNIKITIGLSRLDKIAVAAGIFLPLVFLLKFGAADFLKNRRIIIGLQSFLAVVFIIEFKIEIKFAKEKLEALFS
ncbi:MAG: hypothetical protein ACTTKL_09175 [Treponema sp.]